MLKREGIPHNVLNAKNHEREAEIVARAGQPGAVTIATNMAGRGTDIKLGPGVVYVPKETIESRLTLEQPYEGRTLRVLLREKPCGLHVIGSERHEARRIDRQLRGRCARQGDPGSSRFYVSLEDDLMRLFGSDRISGIMSKMGIEEGQELEHPWLNRSIETAQRRVEQHNYSIRKRTLEYDDVMNKQREIIYGFRGDIVRSANVREHLLDIVADIVEAWSADALETDESRAAFGARVNSTFPIGLRPADLQAEDLDAEKLARFVYDRVKQAYDLKTKIEDPQALPGLERYILLYSIDSLWQDYLRSMDQLRQGVGLRAYGQQDPLVEYKREAFNMFASLMDNIKLEVVQKIFRSTTSLQAFEKLMVNLPRQLVHNQVSAMNETTLQTLGAGGAQVSAAASSLPIQRSGAKVGRNDPCPCGSGKKYKKCCGAN
jgi:preprotein translocase subunit SecA